MKFPPGQGFSYFSFCFLLLWVYTHPFSAEPVSSGHTSCYEIERASACSSKAAFVLFLFPFWSLLLCVFCCHTSILPYSLLCGWTDWMWPWVGDVPPQCLIWHLCWAVPWAASVPALIWTFFHHFFAVLSGLLPYSHIEVFLLSPFLMLFSISISDCSPSLSQGCSAFLRLSTCFVYLSLLSVSYYSDCSHCYHKNFITMAWVS